MRGAFLQLMIFLAQASSTSTDVWLKIVEAQLCMVHAGSMNMSYDSSNLTTPDVKWLGVRPSDLDRFNIPQQCRLPMTEEDIKTGKKLVRTLDSVSVVQLQ